MKREIEFLNQEIEELKSLHVAWATLRKLKVECEQWTSPFSETRCCGDDELDNTFQFAKAS